MYWSFGKILRFIVLICILLLFIITAINGGNLIVNTLNPAEFSLSSFVFCIMITLLCVAVYLSRQPYTPRDLYQLEEAAAVNDYLQIDLAVLLGNLLRHSPGNKVFKSALLERLFQLPSNKFLLRNLSLDSQKQKLILAKSRQHHGYYNKLEFIQLIETASNLAYTSGFRFIDGKALLLQILASDLSEISLGLGLDKNLLESVAKAYGLSALTQYRRRQAQQSLWHYGLMNVINSADVVTKQLQIAPGDQDLQPFVTLLLAANRLAKQYKLDLNAQVVAKALAFTKAGLASGDISTRAIGDLGKFCEYQHASGLRFIDSSLMVDFYRKRYGVNSTELFTKSLGLLDRNLNSKQAEINEQAETSGQAGDSSERFKLLQERLQENLVGQKPLVKAITKALQRLSAASTNSSRPLASFALINFNLGLVTRLQKVLAECYLGSSKLHFTVHLDGNPDWEGLSSFVKRHPFAIIHFQLTNALTEVERNLLQELIEHGRVNSPQNLIADLANSVILVSSPSLETGDTLAGIDDTFTAS